MRTLRERRELGDLGCELLQRPCNGQGLLGDPTIVMLAWLQHVDGTITRSGRSSADGLWAACNVHPVLRQGGADP